MEKSEMEKGRNRADARKGVDPEFMKIRRRQSRRIRQIVFNVGSNGSFIKKEEYSCRAAGN
jgi:hypothetical protein